MRLAYCVRAIFPQHGYGGLERSASGLLRHLLSRGMDVALYTRPLPAGEPLHLPVEVAGRLAVRAARYGRLPLPPNGIPARLTNYRLFVEDMGRRVEAVSLKGQLHGIYAHGLCAWGVRRARNWGVPMIANPHGMEEFKIRDPLKRLAYAPFRAWVRAGCRAADRVVATDFSMQAEVSTILGVDPANVVALPNGVDVHVVHASVDPAVQNKLRERWLPGGEIGEKLLGISVGRMEANKGFAHLLKALALAQADLGAGWCWFFVGDGSLKADLQRRAGELGLGDHVVFTGKVSDTELHSLYSLCNLFAHPTLYEGSSLVTLEAMAHALPVVASATGGIPDKVIEGETGFLVPPAGEEVMSEKIRWMARHPGARRQMGMRGLQLAQEKFSWEHVAALTEELFLSLIDEKSPCRNGEEQGRPC